MVNDDKVQPKRGFGAHPHKNMEIFTYVVSGEITHKGMSLFFIYFFFLFYFFYFLFYFLFIIYH